jgi:hypothetical protein
MDHRLYEHIVMPVLYSLYLSLRSGQNPCQTLERLSRASLRDRNRGGLAGH